MLRAPISLDRDGTLVASSLVMSDEKPELPKYLFLRGNMIWYSLPNADGKWKNKTTGYRYPAELEAAKTMLASILRGLRAHRERAERGDAPVDTFREYVKQWLADREAREIGAVDQERARLDKYVLPVLGDMTVEEIRPRHIRDLVRALRARKGKDKIAPRTVVHIFMIVHNVFESAFIDELVLANPVKVKSGELPKKVDADPEWRANATYIVREVERLISDPIIPAQRRVQYALKALTGMRHGEIAALCWRHLDYTFEPLPRITVAQAWDTPERELKSTKTEQVRYVPMHPTLKAVLASWKLEHWERVYGRKPTPDDYVVPTRNFTCVDGGDAAAAFHDDLDALELRKEAGKKRRRGGHDLRAFYRTRLQEDGADSQVVRATTHAPDKSVDGGYTRFSWSVMCREIGKLRVSILDGKVLPLLTESLQAEAKAGARWRNRVTPKGLEPSNRAPTSEHLSGSTTNVLPTSDRLRARTALRPSAERPLQTAARMLERALRAGDTARAIRIARELRDMGHQE